ncbi:STAM-binding protein-like, partial [Diaphorina citri]|uniref:STAM-binding protein-like n=1 Tax=Diaphorina citri TaxID=121845 RepID=A0A3Q0JEG0_DIACI
MNFTDIRAMPPDERVKKLSNPDINIELNTPIRRYFRGGLELLRQADSYYESGEYDKCYQYYMKYLIMFVDKLPNHPEYKSVPPAEKKEIKKKRDEVCRKAEEIKVRLREKYQAEHEAYLIEKEKRDKELQHQQLLQKQQESKRKLSVPDKKPGGPALHYDRIEALDKTYAQVKQVGPLPDNIYPSFDAIMSSPSRMGITAGAKPDSPASSITSVPSFDRTKKPTVPATQSKDYGLTDHLRPVVIPAALLSSFLVLAQRNTDMNVETCGILAGRLVQSELHITHLLIPKQAGTADSCITHHEEEIFACQDKYNLITLGWIHWQLHITHLLIPKQAGTADSCITHHEEEIFACQDKYNLITLGWIHELKSSNCSDSSNCTTDGLSEEAVHVETEDIDNLKFDPGWVGILAICFAVVSIVSYVGLITWRYILEYFRGGLELLRQADSYYESGEYDKCYQYYMKYLIMFVDKLPNHPEYKSVPPAEKKEIKKKRDEVCRKAEEIKVRLREKYQAEHEAYLIEKEKRDKELQHQQLLQKQQESKRKLSVPDKKPGGPALHYDRIEALDKTYAQVKQVGPLPDNIYPSFDAIMSSPSRMGITAG